MTNNVGAQISMQKITEYLISLPQNPIKIIMVIVD